MRITIETIRHEDQRYSTCGDWLFPDPNHLVVHVSEMGDWRYEMAVAAHEMVEALLCQASGVSQEQVDAFDNSFSSEDGEPGDDPEAPYHKQHCFATAVERLLIAALGVSWADYEEAVEALP
jgi:hypothetical protein